LFWALVVAFNVTGLLDILIDYYNGVTLGLPALSGQLAATYVIPIIYVPILTVTHVAAFMLLARSAPKARHLRRDLGSAPSPSEASQT
jgi:hypothetical protein